MTTPKLTLWYLGHTFVNAVKRAWKVVAIVVACCLLFGAGMGFLAVSTANDSAADTSQSEEFDAQEAIPEVETLLPGGMVLGDALTAAEIIEAIAGGVAALFLLMGIWSGAQNGGAIFQMADANLLFPAPLKPQSVLMFRMTTQLGSVLLGSVYILGQIPNLVLNAGLSGGIVAVIMGTWFLVALLGKLVSVFTYTLVMTRQSLQRFVKPVVYGCIALPFVLGGGYFLATRNVFDTLRFVLTTPQSRLIPFWGWIKGMVGCLCAGEVLPALVLLGITLVGAGLFIWLTWHMKADFYEDAMATAQKTSEKLAAAKEKGGTFSASKHGTKGARRKWDKRRELTCDFAGYEGAKVFFRKMLLQRRRFGSLGGLLSSAGSTYLVVSVGFGLLSRWVSDTPLFLILPLILMVLLLFRTVSSPFAQDLSRTFLYLIPEPPRKMMLWGLAGDLLDGAIDLALPMLVGAVLCAANPLNAVCWWVFLLCEYLCLAVENLFCELVLPAHLPKPLTMMFSMFIRGVPMIPVILVLALGSALALPVGLVLAGGVNVLIAAFLFLFCPDHIISGK